ncbi:MAG: hypothetical protein J6Z49_05450 [Kiritimatiellae bacterium]|nr:hypothetical protein [Kiritimatiellia bacterium]
MSDSVLFPIVVVGPSGAGKTHFLTVLAHLLCEGALWPSYWTATRIIRQEEDQETEGSPATNGSPDEFVNWEEKLYPSKSGKGEILGGTTKRSKEKLPLSLVIHLAYSGGVANKIKEPYRKRDVLLAFTDTAGEDLVHGEWSEVSKKYPILGNKLAEGLIALVNPTQLSTIRDECRDANALRKGKYEQSGLQMSVYATLQSVLSIPEIRKTMKRKPIAVCLTKTDALVNLDKLDPQDLLVGSQDIVSRTESDAGLISLSNLELLSEKTEAYMADLDNDNGFREGKPAHDGITGAVNFFKYHAFFATDALGSAIQTARSSRDSQGNEVRMFTGQPMPRRILDPLLWVLWQHGLVGGRK